MIDWESRIDDLASLLARDYNIHDRVAIDILLSGLIHSERLESVWLILETNWYSRDCLDAWFSFGELWMPCSLPRLRARSPWREIEAETKEWLDSPSEERLFIEPDFERFPYFNRLTQAQYLLQRSLRMRAKSARAADPLRTLDKYIKERMTDELAAATRFVLEDRVMARPTDPPAFVLPPNFLYHVELVQRLAPWFPDWNILVKAFALLAVRHAFLYGRHETEGSDYAILARVAQDSIPPWIATVIQMLLEGPSQTPTLEKRMILEEKTRRSGHGAHRELVRLRRNSIIEWSKYHQHWALAEAHREGLRAILENRAFGANC
jgi:hypothetical protein